MAKKKTEKKTATLLYADCEHSADQLYLSGFFVPDPFVSMVVDGRRIVLLNALEIARARKESTFDEVCSWEEWMKKAEKRYGKKRPGVAAVVAEFARSLKRNRFRVPRAFPYGLACELNGFGISLEVAEGELFPERQIKSDDEARFLKKANACSAAGIRAAERMLKSAVVRKGKLSYQGRPLTSEILKEGIERACLAAGGLAARSIAAGGDQACDPHCSGTGVLRANELIIVDVFPRMKESGYFGDMTRTFLKGTPSDRQRELVAAVKEAQTRAINAIRPGTSGKKVHNEVVSVFQDRGFKTVVEHGVPQGFFHGTGHGLGLEIHEPPRISPVGPRLRKGHVVTVEPGLYYPGLGGARIEDVVRVMPGAPEKLSSFHYRWVVP